MTTDRGHAEGTQTDLTGRCFISYRRSHVDDVGKIVEAMLDVGVPPWQDVRNLDSEPLEPAITRALSSPETAGCVVWISEDFATSATISKLEAPLVAARSDRDPDFIVEAWLADNLPHARATDLFRPAGVHTDLYRAWNLQQAVSTLTTAAGGGQVLRISHDEARRVAGVLLRRRLAKIHERLPSGEPIRLLLNAHGEAGEAPRPGFAIQLNWARHFSHRFAAADCWRDRLLPALSVVLDAVRSSAPGRGVLAEGRATLAACLALGRAFREVTDTPIAWLQKPSTEIWSYSSRPDESGFVSDLRAHDRDSDDLAVLVSVTGDVEPAVVATGDLPAFRALLRVRPSDGAARRDLVGSQANHLAQLVVSAIRDAKRDLRTIQRTHLFLAGPTGLAVLVGRLLNALGPVQTYEHEQQEGVGSYRAAALLTDPTVAR